MCDQCLEITGFLLQISQLNLGDEPVIGIDADASVLDALSLMSTNGVSSVAVLRGDRNVLGNISMTDVKVQNYL